MKKLIAITLILAALLALSACGGSAASSGSGQSVSGSENVSSQQNTEPVVLAELAAQMIAALEPQGEMIDLEQSAAENYFELGDFVKEYSFHISGVWLAEEVSVVEASSDADVEAVKKMLETRKSDYLGSLDGYKQEEYELYQNAEILVQGRFVCLIAGPNIEAARQVFTNYQF